MSGKSEHRLVRVWNEGVGGNFTYAYRCSCGQVDRGYIHESYARDGHAEHVQESEPVTLSGGFVVTESLHGQECEGCRKEARSAAIHARAMGSVGATHQTMKVHDPWEDPEVAHSATVSRVENDPGVEP